MSAPPADDDEPEDVPSQETPMRDAYGPSDLDAFERQVEAMNVAPFNTPPKKYADAVQAVRRLRVRPAPDAAHVWLVEGREGTPYQVDPQGCSCPHGQRNTKTKYGCYHAVAAELFQRWQRAVQPLLMPLPQTADERLAGPPQKTAEDALGATMGRQADIQDAEDAASLGDIRETPQEASMVVTQADTTAPREETPAAPVPSNGSTGLPFNAARAFELPLRSIHAIMADLAKPIPEQCISTRRQDGRDIRYIHWYIAAKLLDAYAPGWNGTVVRIEEVSTVVGKSEALTSVKAWAITYRITVPCAEGQVFREAVGLEHEHDPLFGDTMTNAQATAFKRAAALFGIAAELYDRDDKDDALTLILREEKAALLAQLGQELDRRHLPRQEVLTWLKRQTGAVRNADIPVATLKALFAHLGMVEDE